MDGFNLFNDSVQGAVLVIFIIFTPICILATTLRFVSSRISLGKPGIEDWLALGALIFFLTWVAVSCASLAILNGRDTGEMTIDEISEAFKIVWVSSLFFAPNQLCAKLSILCLYHRLFGVNKRLAIWIKGLAIFQILWSIETPLVEAFECTPVYKYWDPLYVGGSCITVGKYLAANETLNSLADFLMAGLAIVPLRELHTSFSTKWKLALLFAVGGLAGIIGFIKIGFAFNVNVHNQILMGLWATLQMAFSIICCCAITYGPLFRKPTPKTHTTGAYSGGTYGQSWPLPSGRSRVRSANDEDLEGRGKIHHFATEISSPQRPRFSAGSGEQALLAENDPNGVMMKTIRVEHKFEASAPREHV